MKNNFKYLYFCQVHANIVYDNHLTFCSNEIIFYNSYCKVNFIKDIPLMFQCVNKKIEKKNRKLQKFILISINFNSIPLMYFFKYIYIMIIK